MTPVAGSCGSLAEDTPSCSQSQSNLCSDRSPWKAVARQCCAVIQRVHCRLCGTADSMAESSSQRIAHTGTRLPLIGLARERQAIPGALGQRHSLLVLGPGGSGKTTLVQSVMGSARGGEALPVILRFHILHNLLVAIARELFLSGHRAFRHAGRVPGVCQRQLCQVFLDPDRHHDKTSGVTGGLMISCRALCRKHAGLNENGSITTMVRPEAAL